MEKIVLTDKQKIFVNSPITELGIETKLFNILKSNEIQCLAYLQTKKISEIKTRRTFGEHTLNTLIDILKEQDIHLAIDGNGTPLTSRALLSSSSDRFLLSHYESMVLDSKDYEQLDIIGLRLLVQQLLKENEDLRWKIKILEFGS